MTRNEYIASIMLEAADLLREDSEVEVLDESAVFSILPKFKKMSTTYPELKNAENLIKEVNSLISVNEPKRVDRWYTNALKVLIKIYRYSYTICSAILMPFCILILPVLVYLEYRVIEYLLDKGYMAITKNDLNKAIVELNKMRENVTDKKQRAKLDKMYNDMLDTYKKLDEKPAKKSKDTKDEIEAIDESAGKNGAYFRMNMGKHEADDHNKNIKDYRSRVNKVNNLSKDIEKTDKEISNTNGMLHPIKKKKLEQNLDDLHARQYNEMSAVGDKYKKNLDDANKSKAIVDSYNRRHASNPIHDKINRRAQIAATKNN